MIIIFILFPYISRTQLSVNELIMIKLEYISWAQVSANLAKVFRDFPRPH
jgi:hypothetical protein